MKLNTILLGLMSTSLVPTLGLAQNKSVELLKRQIDSLYTVDQQVQQDIINEKIDSVRRGLFQRQLATFKQHKSYLVAIIDQHGFSGYDLVGPETSNRFFILVQHCDDDPLFQQQVLTLMKPQVDKGNADTKGFAYLTDRILVNSGDLQLYGTQLIYEEGNEGRAMSRGVRCAEKLDERRAEVGLEPIKVYLERATAMHKAMNSKK
jgi:hypothetical protein